MIRRKSPIESSEKEGMPMYKRILVPLFLIFMLLPPAVADAAPLDGWNHIKLRESIFRTEPVMRVNEDGERGTVSFETRIPTPPATVHIGFIIVDEPFAWPVFIKSFTEIIPGGLPATTRHDLSINLKRMRKYLYKEDMKKEGVDFYYRVELWNPQKQSAAYYEEGPTPNIEFFNTEDQGAAYYEGKLRIKEDPGKYWRAFPTVVEGPVLDCITPHSAMISWETDVPTKGKISIGTRLITLDKPESSHLVTITDLPSDTPVTYRIVVDDGQNSYRLPSYSFRTAPAEGSRKRFNFIFLSDSRSGEGGGEEDFAGFNKPVLKAVMKEAFRQQAEFIIFAGDMVDGYVSEADDLKMQLRQWKKAIDPISCYLPVYDMVGNHEFVGDVYEVPKEGKKMIYFSDRTGETSMESVFAREFANPSESFPEPEVLDGKTGPSYEKTVYSFDYANCHFAVLNSNYWYTGVAMSFDRGLTAEALACLGGNRDGYLMGNQLKWLDQDLSRARQRRMEHLFVVLHQPPFPTSGHVDSAMFWGKQETPKGMYMGLNDPAVPMGDVVDMRDRFLRIVSKYEVLAVLAGHEHNYSRMRMDGTCSAALSNPCWQVISGGGGAPYYFYQDKHVPWREKVEAFSPIYNLCILGVDGEQVDLTTCTSTGQVIDQVRDLRKALREKSK